MRTPAEIINSTRPFLTIELTNLCNLDCIMCYREDVDMPEKGFISLDTIKALCEDIRKTGLMFEGLKISWLGEALMHPQIKEILSVLSDHHFFRNIVFDTNMHFVTPAIIDILNSFPCDVFIFCSLDASCSSVYSAVRKNGDFDKVWQNLRHMYSHRAENIYLRYQFIPQALNVDDYESFRKKIFSELGKVKVLCSENTLLRKDYILIRRLIQPGGQQEADRMYNSLCGDINRTAHDEPVSESEYTECCEKIYTMPVIRWNGQLGYCNNDPEMQLSPGNIRDVPFSELFLGDELTFLRKEMCEGRRHGKCRVCDIYTNNISDKVYSAFINDLRAEE